MQSVSVAFTDAMRAPTIVWAAPTVEVDWGADGYDGTGTIDDVSGLAGKITVKHHLDDGYPDEVSFVSGLGVAEAEVALVYGGDGTSAGQYFSPFNTGSPVYGYERDVPPVRIKAGAVTESGIQRCTVFAGQSANMPVKGQTASLKAISAARLKLAKLVQPPAIYSAWAGLTATWPISWALAQCGIYSSPPPRPGCRLWMPMHGSLTPFKPAASSRIQQLHGKHTTGSGTVKVTPQWIDGPYLLATDTSVTNTDNTRAEATYLRLDTGPDLASQTASVGRLEFWVRGDAANLGATPGGGAILGLARIDLDGIVVGGVDINRKAYVVVDDGVHTSTLRSTATVPTDGEWHFVGMAWSVTGNKLWVNIDGTVETSTPSPAMSTAGLPASDDFDAGAGIGWTNYLPVAELQLSSGSDANPDSADWLVDIDWTASAQQLKSQLALVALIETQPREAWEFIGAFAQGELATLRTDELDIVRYLTREYWAAVSLTPADTISTALNAEDLPITLDVSKIRNQVRVTYTHTVVDGYTSNVWTDKGTPDTPSTITVLAPHSTTTVTAILDRPVVWLEDRVTTTDGPTLGTFGVPSAFSYVTANSAIDGSGSYANSSQVIGTVTAWTPGTATIALQNTTGSTWYVINDVSLSPLGLSGLAATSTSTAVTSEDAASIAARGVRALPVDVPAVQHSAAAQDVADQLVADLATPVAVIGDVEVLGDPRRQPGDIVAVVDAATSQVDGVWRLASVTHQIDGPDYRQTVTARRVNT